MTTAEDSRRHQYSHPSTLNTQSSLSIKDPIDQIFTDHHQSIPLEPPPTTPLRSRRQDITPILGLFPHDCEIPGGLLTSAPRANQARSSSHRWKKPQESKVDMAVSSTLQREARGVRLTRKSWWEMLNTEQRLGTRRPNDWKPNKEERGGSGAEEYRGSLRKERDPNKMDRAPPLTAAKRDRRWKTIVIEVDREFRYRTISGRIENRIAGMKLHAVDKYRILQYQVKRHIGTDPPEDNQQTNDGLRI
ncbi:hypothetical protein GOBAR_AA39000 [Gossypium barbadense]|uniref:Uncharacterized protein n=1 Tax=Gossypium barbadense TaxID=3634 RepID=A0A2P5VS89_GOSBA|nr:hypothetical protein GOBAR_AA39000 [Gossypium barbadense]